MIPIISLLLIALASRAAGQTCHVYVTGLSVISYTTVDSSSWTLPYVVFGCTDNGHPTNSSFPGCGYYTRGFDFNSGISGATKSVFIGAKVEQVCEGSTYPVMTNATISNDPTCASVEDGTWRPAEGMPGQNAPAASFNDGVAGAPATYVCIKYGTVSNTNLYGIYASRFTTPIPDPNMNWGTYQSSNIKAGTNGVPVYLTMRMSECGGQCANGGACFDTACGCQSNNCPVVAAPTPVGCFSDNVQGAVAGPAHELPYRVNYTVTGATIFSPNQCVASCTNAGFAYAGSQNGGDCYCGNSYGSYCPAASGVCTQACNNIPGSPLSVSSLTCGAVNANTIYRVGAGGSGQTPAATCSCGSPGKCAGVSASISAFGCYTATDASTIDFSIASTSGGTAPYKYSLGGAVYSTNTQFSVVTEGNYTVSTVDANGVSFITTVFAGPAKRVTVTPTPYTPYGTLSGYRTSAVGTVDAVVNAVAASGTAPYKYTLYPTGVNVAYAGSAAGAFSALGAGNYSLIATDANGCRSPPVQITVYTPVLASPPPTVSASDMAVNNKPMATISWTVPYFNGYSAITGYSVLLGYWNAATSSIVWTSNATVAATTTTLADVMNNSTRRFASVATINGVGLGAYSPAVEFVGLCNAGRFANTTFCQDCAPGSNTVGYIGKTVCRLCGEGTYSLQAAPTCTACVGNTVSATGASSCTFCGAGYIADPNHYYCQPCAAGYYNGGSNTTCTACPANTYSSQPGSSSCVNCPAGMTSNQGSYQCQDSTGYKK